MNKWESESTQPEKEVVNYRNFENEMEDDTGSVTTEADIRLVKPKPVLEILSEIREADD